MIGLIDVDSKLPNLALMKISSYFKSMGEQVEFVKRGLPLENYERIYASSIFTRSRATCEQLMEKYGDRLVIGGTGWSLTKELPPEIDGMMPDYDLYTTDMIYERIKFGVGKRESKIKKAETIINAGLGFSSRGCCRNCTFCVVPRKEGKLHQVAEIKDLISPKSNVLILNDNNLTADPNGIEKLHEIRDRKLTVDINQGVDVRLMTDELSQALSEVKHLRSLHYSWDLMQYEDSVIRGIQALKQYVPAWRHMCFMLVGFNTTFEEDMYRFRRLRELKVDAFVMIYNQKPDVRLKHFARWVNGRFYKVSSFERYEPWLRVQQELVSKERQLTLAFCG